MTVAELIERLNELDPDTEIRLATQPSYPLQSTIRGVAALEDGKGGHSMAYIVEGSQVSDSPYAPSEVFDESW